MTMASEAQEETTCHGKDGNEPGPRVDKEEEDVPSLYETSVTSVEVTTDVGKRDFSVHQSVLDKMAYFTVQQARWMGPGDKLKVQLSSGARFKHFVCILDHLYRPSQRVRFSNISDGILVSEAASMLGCDSKTVDLLKISLRAALRTEDDLALLREACDVHDLPLQLQPIAQRSTKRPRIQNSEITLIELQVMLHNAAQLDDDETIQYVGRHLKQRSRLGGSVLQEVSTIIRNEGALVDTLAYEFLRTHPKDYGKFIEAWSNHQATKGQPGCCIELLNIGVVLFGEGSIGDEDIVACCELVINTIDEEWAHDFGLSLRSLDGALQLKVIEELLSQSSRGVSKQRWIHITTHFLYAEVIDALALEPKAFLLSKVVALSDFHAIKVAHAPLLRAFGASLAEKICGRLVQVKDDDTFIDHVVNVQSLQAFGEHLAIKICRRISKVDVVNSGAELEAALDSDVLNVIGVTGVRALLPIASACSAEVKRRIFESAAPDVGDDSEDGF